MDLKTAPVSWVWKFSRDRNNVAIVIICIITGIIMKRSFTFDFTSYMYLRV